MEDTLKRSLKTLKEHEAVVSMFFGALVVLILGISVMFFWKRVSPKPTRPQNDLQIAVEIALSPTRKPFQDQLIKRLPTLYVLPAENGETRGFASLIKLEEIKEALMLVNKADKGRITETSAATEATQLAQPKPQNDTNTTYVVRSGDNLWTIAQKFYHNGNKYSEIVKTNQLSNINLINPGQVLKIPVVPDSTVTSTSYTVIKGDSLWRIAEKTYGSGFEYPKIAAANAVVIKNPQVIEPGWVLVIPRT